MVVMLALKRAPRPLFICTPRLRLELGSGAESALKAAFSAGYPTLWSRHGCRCDCRDCGKPIYCQKQNLIPKKMLSRPISCATVSLEANKSPKKAFGRRHAIVAYDLGNKQKDLSND